MITMVGIAASPSPLYSPTPFGEVLTHCAHEVPSGARVSVQSDWSILVDQAATTYTIPPCDTNGGAWPVWRSSTTPGSKAQRPLPPDYDGWLEYTALNVSALGLSGGFDSFTSTMSVPDVPKKKAHMLYFFPGLQSTLVQDRTSAACMTSGFKLTLNNAVASPSAHIHHPQTGIGSPKRTPCRRRRRHLTSCSQSCSTQEKACFKAISGRSRAGM